MTMIFIFGFAKKDLSDAKLGQFEGRLTTFLEVFIKSVVCLMKRRLHYEETLQFAKGNRYVILDLQKCRLPTFTLP